MTNEQIRIAVAECCGWQWYRIPSALRPESPLRSLFHPALHEYEGQSEEWKVKADMTERIANMQYMVDEGHIPNYIEDLNSCHEMEKSLSDEQALVYGGLLKSTVNRLFWFHATALQRCEAFLRTLGKWKD